jgi:hypothetical protein
MLKSLFNVSTLFYAPLLALSLWGQTSSHQNETNYRRIDELEAYLEEVIQNTERMEASVQVGHDRIEQYNYLSETTNY